MPLKHNTKSPIIGFPLDYELGKEPGTGYSNMPHYAVRENYCSSLSQHGAAPLPLVHEMSMIDAFLDGMDGLLILGGAFDIHPSLYGGGEVHETVSLKESRTQFEWKMAEKAIERGMPVLGICGGEQLLAVVLGGTLIQHIPDSYPDSAIEHEQPNPRTEAGHNVAIEEGTLLHNIVGKDEIPVNSAHHQSVESVGKDCVINATAPDGVIEGLEYTKHPFCIGVQWHPEYHISPADTQIFKAFVAACKN